MMSENLTKSFCSLERMAYTLYDTLGQYSDMRRGQAVRVILPNAPSRR